LVKINTRVYFDFKNWNSSSGYTLNFSYPFKLIKMGL
jgi:hypothetical protein